MNANYAEALEQQIRLLRLTTQNTLMNAAFEYSSAPHAAKRQGAAAAHGSLVDAAPFYWPSTFCRLLSEVSITMPAWTLTEDCVPVYSGFWWFAEPLKLPKWGDDKNDLRAISWMPLDDDGIKLQVVFWIDEPMARGGPWPTDIVAWPLGQTQDEAAAYATTVSQALYPERVRAKYQTFAAGLAFLQQRIVVAEQQQADRHARKRLERIGFCDEPLVNVIRLRQADRSGSPDYHGAMDWSCQWVVRGHWRQQFYPSKHAYQPIWITPYVKGPDDKPLKAPRATVFAVVR